MKWIASPITVVVAALFLSSCGNPSHEVLSAEATAACLKQHPDYVSKLDMRRLKSPREVKVDPPVEDELHPGAKVVEISVFRGLAADPTGADVTFFEDDAQARHFYDEQRRRPGYSKRVTLILRRNVVIGWVFNPTADDRALVEECLTS